MVTSCIAIGCTNHVKAGSGISFHRFPLSRPELLHKWVRAVRRENWTPNKHSYICSDHFHFFLFHWETCFSWPKTTFRCNTLNLPNIERIQGREWLIRSHSSARFSFEFSFFLFHWETWFSWPKTTFRCNTLNLPNIQRIQVGNGLIRSHSSARFSFELSGNSN